MGFGVGWGLGGFFFIIVYQFLVFSMFHMHV